MLKLFCMSTAVLTAVQARSILSKASGYISGFDFTLNPYSGCGFACAYCYAAFFAGSIAKKEDWGRWVEVKQNAAELLRKAGGRLAGKAIYMSSVTDPYQPVELKLGLTRSLLELMLPHQPRLVVQTRSPFVTRDLDLLRQFQRVRVNMSITTDDDAIRKVFEPLCASIPRRLAAIEEVKAAGVPTGICLTPLLPVTDADAFGPRLRAANADVYVIQQFQAGNARFAAGTRPAARTLAQERGWTEARYQEVRTILARHLPHLFEGREGFMPPPLPLAFEDQDQSRLARTPNPEP
jgi:DNA repair photolyase